MIFKAWFRELPTGVLDSLSPEQVMQCQTEDDCAELVRQLPHTEASLLDWAINLMADVVQEERLNKMNARNIAMVFAPNMTHVSSSYFLFSNLQHCMWTSWKPKSSFILIVKLLWCYLFDIGHVYR